MKTYIIGHRGAMGERPENTENSFKKALDDGADGVEFDLHLCKDGVPVVIHDETVDRTTDGTGLVTSMTLAEVKNLEAGNVEFPGERILTLEETLDLVADRCNIINIELKQGPVFYPGMEEMVLDIIREYGIVDKVIISSFNHYSIKVIKDRLPALRCGLLYMAGLYQPWIYAKNVGVEAVHPFIASINEEVVKGCRENNIQVNVFGGNSKEAILYLLKIGVDGIITDYPGLAVSLRDKGM